MTTNKKIRAKRKLKSDLKKLEEFEYYKLMFLAEAMHNAEARADVANKTRRELELEIQVRESKIKLVNKVIKDRVKTLDECRIEYNNFRSDLEKRLNVSLSNCEIDGKDFTIKKTEGE